jgi:hypothetical protein
MAELTVHSFNHVVDKLPCVPEPDCTEGSDTAQKGDARIKKSHHHGIAYWHRDNAGSLYARPLMNKIKRRHPRFMQQSAPQQLAVAD